MTDPVCPAGTEFATAVDAVRRGHVDVDAAARQLIAKLTVPEVLGLLDGDEPLWRGLPAMARRYNGEPIEAGRVDRLGIPGIRFTDGPRGVVVGSATSFPVAIARAASWDIELQRRIGDAIGQEARAQGANLFAGVCVNLPPVPGWGRSQESYGEDPVLIGAMGAALVEGAKPWVMTCVKHFALNSMEEARFVVDVQVADDVLHEVYLPHFRAAVEAGADAIMSAYNSINGTWAGENRDLLTGILRERWGFPGFVMTDFTWGLRHPVESLTAGQDLEMPFRQQRAASLPQALRDRRLAREDVERAAARLLAAQIALALRARPRSDRSIVAGPEHRALARQAAQLGMVMLRNDQVDGAPLLPLHENRLERLAVLGALADAPNLGDVGSSQVHPPDSVTVLQGLRERLGERVAHVAAGDLVAGVRAARNADAAVVVVGLSSRDEGESLLGVDTDAVRLMGRGTRWGPVARVLAGIIGQFARSQGMGGDRRDLHLRASDVELITAVSAVNPRTVVVVIAGGTIMPDPWDADVAAILLAWYPGMEGGRAIADVLLGDAEPGGRLPVAIPRVREHLPMVDWRARRVVYDRWFGQRRLDRDGHRAAYPFGFGLGYTSFRISALELGPVTGEHFEASVTITNTGDRRGRDVVQLYATPVESTSDEAGVPQVPGRRLAGFQPVELDAGRTATVRIWASLRPLQRWTGTGFVLPARSLSVEAAAYAGDPDAVTATLRIR